MNVRSWPIIALLVVSGVACGGGSEPSGSSDGTGSPGSGSTADSTPGSGGVTVTIPSDWCGVYPTAEARALLGAAVNPVPTDSEEGPGCYYITRAVQGSPILQFKLIRNAGGQAWRIVQDTYRDGEPIPAFGIEAHYNAGPTKDNHVAVLINNDYFLEVDLIAGESGKTFDKATAIQVARTIYGRITK